MSIIRGVWAAIWRAVSWIGNLLPAPPSDEAPGPDIDGRRRDDDPYAALHANQHGKEGHGGFR